MAEHRLEPLPDNSKSGKKAAEERKAERHAEQVAKGTLYTPTSTKLLRTFIARTPREVAEDLWRNQIVPGIKDAIVNGMDMLIRDETPRSYSKSNSLGRVSTAYDRISSDRGDRERDNGSNSRSVGRSRSDLFDFDSVSFETREDATQVLQDLFDEVVTYDKVSCSYFYELAGVSVDYPVAKYGWTKDMLEGLRVERLRNGLWVVPLPKPIVLD